MSVPVVTNIVPARGPTSGRALVEVYGDGFRLPTESVNPSGVTAAAPASVEILFDDEPATDVQVLRTNRLAALTPVSPISGEIVRMLGDPDLTFVPGTPDTIVRSAGSWRDDGFRSGQTVTVEQADEDANNTDHSVASMTATVLTLETSGAVSAEGPTSGARAYTRAYGEGKVDVTVRNVDDDGDPISGETVTVSDGYAFSRVQLADAAHLTRLVREYIIQWRKQVIPNVSTTTHTEYDDETGDELNITAVADLPGIAVDGPDISENRFFSENGTITVELPSGDIVVRRVPYTVDLSFVVTGVSDHKGEATNLQVLATQFVNNNPYIYLDRDPDDPSQGRVRYEHDFVPNGDFDTTGVANLSNVRTFSGTVVIRGFDIEDLAGFDGELGRRIVAPVDEDGIDITTAQTGASYDVGPSPGGDC